MTVFANITRSSAKSNTSNFGLYINPMAAYTLTSQHVLFPLMFQIHAAFYYSVYDNVPEYNL